MVKLEDVTKVYPGSRTPAVDQLSFEVPTGETCVLIGPSGCGKTTTLKMVNRLIEPTSGRIFINRQNLMEQNPVELRRRIGYVIQQIGLFPHMTIQDNIGVVPRLLGWDKARIDTRADELIDLVGLDPTVYRHRYPRELSGGQRQRIGVARALAADPPVMLMDEPFGAIDPITRDHLQNEFLNLQEQLQKTILFVTHDIDEAIKMGTLICILQVGGVLAQFDSPANILANPADEFVADFVGADRGLKRLNLVRVRDVMHTEVATIHADDDGDLAREKMLAADREHIWVLDSEKRLIGYVSLKDAEKFPHQAAQEMLRDVISTTEEHATMKDAFSEMLSFGIRYMAVLDRRSRFLGVITADDAQQLIAQKPVDAEQGA